MKRLIFLLITMLFPLITSCGGSNSFSSSNSNPATISFKISPGCSNNNSCNEFQVYRHTGSCPNLLDNSIGWSDIGTTTNLIFIDSNVVSGTIYSYDVEAINGAIYSGPSNCITKEAE